MLFYDHARQSAFQVARDRGVEIQLPPISYLTLEDATLQTQVTSVIIDTEQLLSVLITDEHFETSQSLKTETRTARYDGFVKFGSDISLIMENKPNSSAAYEEQLRPADANLGEGCKLVDVPAVLEWKEIIADLTDLSNVASFGGAEKLIVTDFLDFIDQNFSFLNPYDNFSLCKGDEGLIRKRIKSVLISIADNTDLVKSHRGWADYIETDLAEIRKIGVPLDYHEGNWRLTLALYFADIISQARPFYTTIDVSRVVGLEKNGWELKTNFHVSFKGSWLQSFYAGVSVLEYLAYWKQSVGEIRQYSRDDLFKYLVQLNEKKIVLSEKGEIEKLKSRSERMPWLNVCPGVSCVLSFPAKDVENLDREGKFAGLLDQKIREGIGILGKEITFLKKH
jgi:hypothetical protein